MTQVQTYVPLAQVRRNGVQESLHYGAIAVVNLAGQRVYSAGDAASLCFGRSALKPFQALPFFAAGGVAALGLSPSEAALLCASHSGEARHAQAAASILEKAGASAAQLRCGCHVPYRFSWFDQLPPAGETWSALHHNCSGKHAGFIAAARLMGKDSTGYLDATHPVQTAARAALAACAQLAPQDLVAGIDGCSAPTYALPLDALAQAFARLAAPTPGIAGFDAGLNQVFDTMTAHPEMVSGLGRNDAALMHAGRGDWVTKIGAEAVQCIGIRSAGLGIAIKMADGQTRGLYPATVAVLDTLGLLDAQARQDLAPWRNPVLKNSMGIAVGDVWAD